MHAMLTVLNCTPGCCAPSETADQEHLAPTEAMCATFMLPPIPWARWAKGTFVVDFESGDPRRLGIEFSTVEENELVVVGVVPNPDQLAHAYNSTAADELQILPGDRVVAVNGSEAPASTLLSTLSRADNISLTFQHALLERISVQKKGKRLGLVVNKDRRPCVKYLQVEKVNEGVILDYNMTIGSRGMQPGDRIVEVNGVRGTPEALLRELTSKEKDEVQLVYFLAPAHMGG